MSDENTLRENDKFNQSEPGVSVTWLWCSANQNAHIGSRDPDVNRILGEN